MATENLPPLILGDQPPFATRQAVEELLSNLEEKLPKDEGKLDDYYKNNPSKLIALLSLHRYLLHTDALTGLKTKIGAEEAFDRLKARVVGSREQDTGIQLVALVVDVNGFRNLNSGLTHDVGDSFLGNLSAELSLEFRDTSRPNITDSGVGRRSSTTNLDDTVVIRIKGNEFIVMLPVPTGSHLNHNDLILSFSGRVESAFARAQNRTIEYLEAHPTLISNDENIGVIENLSQSTSPGVYGADLLDGKDLGVIIDELTAKKGLVPSLDEIGAAAVRAAHELLSALNSQKEEGLKTQDLLQAVFDRRDRILAIEKELEDIIAIVKDTRDILEENDFKNLDLSQKQRNLIIELVELYKKAIDIDNVTGLKNRHWLERKLAGIIEGNSQESSLIVDAVDTDQEHKGNKETKDPYIKDYLLMIDMAHFGGVNVYNNGETEAGDTILQKFSEILQSQCDSLGKTYGFKASAVRTGGDEFHIVLEGVDLRRWLDERIIDVSDAIEDAESHFKAELNRQIVELAQKELKIFMRGQVEMYPSLALHTGELTEIRTPEGLAQGSDIKEKVRVLIITSEVKKNKPHLSTIRYLGNVGRSLFELAKSAMTRN